MKRTPLKRGGPLKRTRMKRSSKPAVPKEIKDHWGRVIKLGCIVTFSDQATIHHVHGGSIRDRFGSKAMPGTAQKQNDWLVIPLHPSLHTGQNGIDNGMGTNVASWERKWGPQAAFLDRVRDMIRSRHGYDIYEKAGIA